MLRGSLFANEGNPLGALLVEFCHGLERAAQGGNHVFDSVPRKTGGPTFMLRRERSDEGAEVTKKTKMTGS